MQWIKEDLLIMNAEGRYTINVKEDVHMYVVTLIIHKVTQEDAGSYKFTVRNNYGELTASASLLVNSKSIEMREFEDILANNSNEMLALPTQESCDRFLTITFKFNWGTNAC